MPGYRRYRVPGATYFLTLVTDGRRPLFQGGDARRHLREVIEECQNRWAFRVEAMVLLPDHMHALWALPAEDADYSKRLGWVKKEFTKRWLADGGVERPVSDGRRAERRRGVWQPRFWEHLIRDEDDFAAHADYVHYNPVKHRLAATAAGWQWSTFHRFVEDGIYPPAWGQAGDERLEQLAVECGE